MTTLFPQNQIVAAHKHCTANRAELLQSEICACLYYLSTFPASDIDLWVEEAAELDDIPPDAWTAMCPKCPVDAVIGSASGYPITNPAFLKAMHEYWF